MTTDILTLVLVAGIGMVLAASVVGFIVISKLIRNLNKSFAKLGFIAREDAKKYFGDAADKVVDMNSNFFEQYQEMIDGSVRKVLSESGQVMAASLAKVEKEAGEVILKAQENARQITLATERDAEAYYKRTLSKSVDAMEWALEQYMGDHLDIKKHDEIVKRLLEEYVNERRT